MRKFLILVKKEVRELLTLQVILPLIVTALMFMFIGNIMSKEQAKAKNPQNIVLVNEDGSNLSNAVVESLKSANINVDLSLNTNIDDVVKSATNANKTAVLVIPKGFESGILTGDQKKIDVYTVIKNFSVMGSSNYANLLAAISLTNETISTSLIQTKIPNFDANILKTPLMQNEFIVVGNKKANISPTQVMGFVSQQTLFIPIILFFVIIFSSQMIATSIASEKENKTLETLLTTPVSRKVIVTAKMVGAGIVALFASVIYMFGFRSYLSGMSGGGQASAQIVETMKNLGLTFTPQSYVLLGISLFSGILVALAISLIIGAFAEDVKGVAGLISPLIIVIAIPYFLTMFTDINSMTPAMRFLVYAIPFSHIFMTAPNLFLHNIMPVIWGIVYQLAIFGIFVWIAARIFSTDKIVTMKLNFSKMKRFGLKN